MLANQAHYHFLLKVQRHLLGQHRYSKWSPSHVLNNVWSLTFSWEEAIHRAFSNDKDPKAVQRYINLIGKYPTYYRNLTAAPSKEFITKEISINQSKNHPVAPRTRPTTSLNTGKCLAPPSRRSNTVASSNSLRETFRLS